MRILLLKDHVISSHIQVPTQNRKAELMNTANSMFDVHAGEILKEEYMDYHGISNKNMAKKVGIEVETMNGIVDGTIPMTAELSKKIGKVVGVSEDFYIGIQECIEKRLDPLKQAIIDTDNPTTREEYYRQAMILVAMSLFDNPKNNPQKAEFSPLYLQKITFLIDQVIIVEESPIFKHENHLFGPNDHGLNVTMERLNQEGFINIKLPNGQNTWVNQKGKSRRNTNRRYVLNSYGMKVGKKLLNITEEQENHIRNIVNMTMGMSVSELKKCV